MKKWTMLISLLVLSVFSFACGYSKEQVEKIEREAFKRGKEIAEQKCETEKEKIKNDFQIEIENQKSLSFYGGISTGIIGTLVGGVLILLFGGLLGSALFFARKSFIRNNSSTYRNWQNRPSPGSVTE